MGNKTNKQNKLLLCVEMVPGILSSEHYSEKGTILSQNVFKRVTRMEETFTTKEYE